MASERTYGTIGQKSCEKSLKDEYHIMPETQVSPLCLEDELFDILNLAAIVWQLLTMCKMQAFGLSTSRVCYLGLPTLDQLIITIFISLPRRRHKASLFSRQLTIPHTPNGNLTSKTWELMAKSNIVRVACSWSCNINGRKIWACSIFPPTMLHRR